MSALRLRGSECFPIFLFCCLFNVPFSSKAQIYEQSPTPGSFPTAFGSHQNINVRADDFILMTNAVIRQIKWWGLGASNGAFEIKFYGDSAGLPGSSLATITDPNNIVTEVISPAEPLFRYTLNLPTDFVAQGGVRYWLSIARNTGTDVNWFWVKSGATGTLGYAESFPDIGSTWRHGPESPPVNLAFALYPAAPPCTPHKATAVAQVVNGFVVGATITDSGCGYTNTPMVVIRGGGGTNATATAVVTNGAVAAINIVNAGCCYTNTPQIIIASPPFVPQVAISFSRVKVTQSVVLGRRYVLEASNDLVTWIATGPPFTADSETIDSEFDIAMTGRYFRLRETL